MSKRPTKAEAIAELARRRGIAEADVLAPIEKDMNEMTDPWEIVEAAKKASQPKEGKRRPSWEEFSTQMPFFGPKGVLPEDVELSPSQSELLAFSGAIDKTGHGIQQNLANLFGADKWGAKNDIAARANDVSAQRAAQDNPEAAQGGGMLGSMASALPLEPLAMSGLLGLSGSAGVWGANQYRNPDESMLVNAAIPAAVPLAIKGATSAATSTVKGLAKRFLGMPRAEIAKDIMQIEGISPEYQQQVLDTMKKRTDAAKKIGVQLTPAEASGSPVSSKQQAEVGRSKAGAGKMEEFYRGEGGRYEQENNAVSEFFKKLGVKAKDVSADTARKVREVAQNIIEEQVQARKALSKPVYKKAQTDTINHKTIDKLLHDENIAHAAETVYKNPAYREAAKKMNKNSIEYWDLIKKRIDADIERASKNGDAHMVSILQNSKRKLLNELDKVSPMYTKARAIFGNESEVLEELTNSNLGKISKLKDTQLKNVSSTLFDPKEIDPKTLDTVRRRLLKENKQVYYDALAQNMKSKMDTVAKSATKREAPAFYSQILKTDKTYNLYKEALKHNPPALRRLEAMKVAFEDLGGDFTPKTAAGLEKTGMTNTRDIIKGLALKLLKSGRYDATAVEFITNPKWFEQADKILAQKAGPKKEIAILNLLTKISQSESAKNLHSNED